MSDPTVEEAREALKFAAINTAEVETLAKVTQLWVDAAEPDIEAALTTNVSDPCDMDGKRDQVNEWFTYRDIEDIIAAAFGANDLIKRAE